jgi:hypothetical protein
MSEVPQEVVDEFEEALEQEAEEWEAAHLAAYEDADDEAESE